MDEFENIGPLQVLAFIILFYVALIFVVPFNLAFFAYEKLIDLWRPSGSK